MHLYVLGNAVGIQQLPCLSWMQNNGGFMEEVGYGVVQLYLLSRLKVMNHGYTESYISN